MNDPGRLHSDEVQLLRIYSLAGDTVGKHSFAQALVIAAREAQLKGATVLPGVSGYGRHGYEPEFMVMVHRPEKQPYVVEIVDAPLKLVAFLPTIARLNRWQRLVTFERVRVHAYRVSR